MTGIRVDGNEEIATGHVMRCLAIAEELKKKEAPIFITADDRPSKLIQAHGFETVSLHTDYRNMGREITALQSVIQAYAIDKLLVDSYFVTEDYFRQLKKDLKTIYIDDIGQSPYEINMLINYNIFADRRHYQTLYANTGAKLLLGCAYVPLRKEFRNITPCFRDKASNVLITSGGTDPFRIGEQLLIKLAEQDMCKALTFHVIAGSMHKNADALKALAEKNSGIIIHQNVEDMAKLMLACDIGVTAGGSTLYELCACGVASVCFAMADNQLPAVNRFADDGLMLYAGDFRRGGENCIRHMVDGVKRLVNHTDKRHALFQKGKGLLDGDGATNIACEIFQL